MRLILIPSLYLLLTACNPAGSRGVEYTNVRNTATVDGSFENVWNDTLGWMAAKGLPLENINKESGIITTKWGVLSASSGFGFGNEGVDETYISCGKPTGNIGLYTAKFSESSISLNVVVRPVARHQTLVTINLNASVISEVRNAFAVVSAKRVACASRGVLENELLNFLSNIKRKRPNAEKKGDPLL